VLPLARVLSLARVLPRSLSLSRARAPPQALRLETMAPVVDRFVIVESWETHSGLAKKERLWKDVHAHVFEPYADKIEWMILETLGPTQEGVPLPSEEIWKREKLQRDAPTEWLRRQAGPWLALICDSDEIVNPDAIKQAKMEPSSFEMPCSLRMDFFYYNFHWVKPGKWYAPYVISDKGVDTHIAKSDATLSIIRDHTRKKDGKERGIDGAGWHASYFASTEDIQRKLVSFAHQECNQPQYTSSEHIAKCIASGVDLFNRGGEENLMAYDVTTLPLTFQKFNDLVKGTQGIKPGAELKT